MKCVATKVIDDAGKLIVGFNEVVHRSPAAQDAGFGSGNTTGPTPIPPPLGL